jgi:hypothetical protein
VWNHREQCVEDTLHVSAALLQVRADSNHSLCMQSNTRQKLNVIIRDNGRESVLHLVSTGLHVPPRSLHTLTHTKTNTSLNSHVRQNKAVQFIFFVIRNSTVDRNVSFCLSLSLIYIDILNQVIRKCPQSLYRNRQFHFMNVYTRMCNIEQLGAIVSYTAVVSYLGYA